MRPKRASGLSPLAANTARQLDVLGHDRHPLAMDGAEEAVLKHPNEVTLGGFLKSHKSNARELQRTIEVLSNLTHKPLERGFEQEELSPLLVPPNLTQGHSAGAEAVRLLDPSNARSGLACSLGGQGLPRSLAASGLSRSLLRACHWWTEMYFPRFEFLLYTPKFPKIAKMVKSHAKSHAKSHTRTGTRRATQARLTARLTALLISIHASALKSMPYQPYLCYLNPTHHPPMNEHIIATLSSLNTRLTNLEARAQQTSLHMNTELGVNIDDIRRLENELAMQLDKIWKNYQKDASRSTIEEFKLLLQEAKPRLTPGSLKNMSMACGHYDVVSQAAKEAGMEYVLY